MQSALRPPRPSVRGWISRNPMIAAGGLMSAIFLFVGLFGTLLSLSTFRLWLASADWPATEAKITASRLLHRVGGRGVRPDFTFTYEWKGRSYTADGYDLVGSYTVGTGTKGGPYEVLEAHPVGSTVKVLVNPERPGQAVFIRSNIEGGVLLCVPPFFTLLGLIGTFFTTITGFGWLNENTRNPLGRAIRAAGGWVIQEKIMKPLIYLIFGSVILGLVVAGVVFENVLLVIFAGVMAWGVWRASRPQPDSGPEDGPGESD